MAHERERRLARKQIFSDIPDEGAGEQEWRAWAIKVQEWAFSMSRADKKRRSKATKLRKELNEKNKVFRHYKKKIGELESRIQEYENNFFFKLGDFIRHLAGKVLK